MRFPPEPCFFAPLKDQASGGQRGAPGRHAILVEGTLTTSLSKKSNLNKKAGWRARFFSRLINYYTHSTFICVMQGNFFGEKPLGQAGNLWIPSRFIILRRGCLTKRGAQARTSQGIHLTF
jgi:hypothetical protein